MDVFLPYSAGFFDGEGSIGIYRNSNKGSQGRTLRVQLTQNVSREATDLLEEARRRWGCSLTLMNRRYNRPAWIWQVSAANGVRALRDFRPWLRLKAKQADIALDFWSERGFAQRGVNGRFLPLSVDIRRRCDEAEEALKAAKREEQPRIPTVPRASAAPGDIPGDALQLW